MHFGARQPGPVGDGQPPGHPCQVGLLVTRLGEWLEPEGDTDSRQSAACAAIRRARPDFEQFVGSRRPPGDLVAVELSIKGHGRDLLSVYGHLPGPTALLLTCARSCRDGDLVSLRQVTAACGALTHEARWPFGPEEAEMMTRPAQGLFAALGGDGVRSAQRRSRRIGALGILHVERAKLDERVRALKVRRWRTDRLQTVRGVHVRLRDREWCIGWERPR